MACHGFDWTKRCIFFITSEDGGVLLDLDNDEFLKLSPAASEMWKLLVGGKSMVEVAREISQQCGVDEDASWFASARNSAASSFA